MGNCLPASPAYSRKIRYNITKASRDTVSSPDCFVISPKVYKSKFKPTYKPFITVTNPAAKTKSIGLLAYPARKIGKNKTYFKKSKSNF